MKSLIYMAVSLLVLILVLHGITFSQTGSSQVSNSQKFLNHPDHNIHNAFILMDFSWWDYSKFNNHYYDVAKVKYLESFRLMGRIEATKVTFLATAREMRANIQYITGKEQQSMLLQVITLENQYAAYNALQRELLNYQQECGKRIMEYTNRYHYNQAESIIKAILLDSRLQYEIGLADRGAIPMRTAKINQSLKNFIYGPPGQLIHNLLEMAGAAVSN